MSCFVVVLELFWWCCQLFHLVGKCQPVASSHLWLEDLCQWPSPTWSNCALLPSPALLLPLRPVLMPLLCLRALAPRALASAPHICQWIQIIICKFNPSWACHYPLPCLLFSALCLFMVGTSFHFCGEPRTSLDSSNTEGPLKYFKAHCGQRRAHVGPHWGLLWVLHFDPWLWHKLSDSTYWGLANAS